MVSIQNTRKLASFGLAIVMSAASVAAMADVMVDDALTAVQRVCPPGTTVDVQMDWDTEWSPERLAPAVMHKAGPATSGDYRTIMRLSQFGAVSAPPVSRSCALAKLRRSFKWPDPLLSL